MITDARRRANEKYHREHIASLACRVRKETAEEFKQYCEAQGKTVNAVLAEFVRQCLGSSEPEAGQE